MTQAPFIYETARVPKTEQTPDGQPIGLTSRTSQRESMDPDTFVWATLVGPDEKTGVGNDNRCKYFVTNAIEPTDSTTTYTWSATSADDGVITFQNEAGTTISGGALGAADLTTIWASFDSADTYTIQCVLSSSETNPANRTITQVTTVTA
jgi:hypothetical protein